MTPPTAAQFPALRRVFAGYLHEDFAIEHGTAADALDAFRRDASSVERRRFAAEAKRFLEATQALDFDKVKTLVASLGSRWTPDSWQALVATLYANDDG